MTLEIGLIFIILITALVLFFTGWVRMDVVALLVLFTLASTGLVSPTEALSGFSNPAVITVWSMFILSAALYQTGVARIIGRYVLRLSGNSEWRTITIIMLSTGLLSAVMNNIGVAALMLPVVMDVARSTGRAPSRLLMPLAYASLLGGLTTLIGTPPNLLVSYALQDAGLEPFGLFDYTPVGLGVMLGGILFVALVGRHLLPRKDVTREKTIRERKALSASYALQERTFLIRIKEESGLNGKTLTESRLRAALGINVLSVKRHGGGTLLDPGPDTIIRANDILFVQGRFEAIKALREWKILLPDSRQYPEDNIRLSQLNFFEAVAGEKSFLLDKNPGNRKIIRQLKMNLLGLKRENTLIWGDPLQEEVIKPGDILLLHGLTEEANQHLKEGTFSDLQDVSSEIFTQTYPLSEAMFVMEIRQDSELFPDAHADSQLAEAFHLNVLGIIREDGQLHMPQHGEKFRSGDRLLVQGNPEDLPLLRGLIDLEFPDENTPEARSLETDRVIMAEVVLAPRSLLAGKTLQEINFRKKYGITVLAIWREGRAYRTQLHNIPLRFGEALLLYGKRDKIELLGSDDNFILLTDTMPQSLRTHKALTASLVMAAILVPVLMGLLPLAISALAGIALMVLTGCLKMEEAYRAIEWRSVFLIAGLLPLGAAMQQTGAATLMAETVIDIFGRWGPWGVLAGLYLLTLISTLAIPPAALVVIMSPVVLQAAESFQVSPYTLMMGISIAAAASFLSPISHPANLLVMGPGGYKFTDYIKLGIPLSLVVMAIVFLLLPIFWPF